METIEKQVEVANLSASQQLFLKAAKEGKNIFLTGKAGTGKSYVVKQLMKILNEQSKKFVAVAPTGIAANNIGGQTIHSLFSLNPNGVLDFKSCNFLKTEKRRLLDQVEVILIDEVSMLRPDVLDGMNFTLLKNGCAGLKTKQVIFIGDMKQLLPPLSDNTRSVLYSMYEGEEFYHAAIYKSLNVVEVELTEVLRQSDPEFIDNLNIIRDGGKSEYFRQFVSDEPDGIVLAPHNSTVELYNKQGLAKIDSPEIVFTAHVEGNIRADDFNLQSEIRVKNGAKIMYLINSNNGELVNGTIGTFVSRNDCYFIKVGEIKYALEKVTLAKKEYVLSDSKEKLELKELGSITQYPIKLAYALSIHKSQGLTFEKVTIDLSKPCFQKGQMYVALSRVKSPDGLKIKVK